MALRIHPSRSMIEEPGCTSVRVTIIEMHRIDILTKNEAQMHIRTAPIPASPLLSLVISGSIQALVGADQLAMNEIAKVFR